MTARNATTRAIAATTRGVSRIVETIGGVASRTAIGAATGMTTGTWAFLDADIGWFRKAVGGMHQARRGVTPARQPERETETKADEAGQDGQALAQGQHHADGERAAAQRIGQSGGKAFGERRLGRNGLDGWHGDVVTARADNRR